METLQNAILFRWKKNKLANSFRKYGVYNHIFEIITLCSPSELYEKERYFQEKYDVIGENGLNEFLNECNFKKRILTKKLRFKIGSANRGKKMSEEKKEKIRRSLNTEENKKRISNGRLKRIGIKQTADHINKRVKYHIGAKRSKESRYNIRNSLRKHFKPVNQMTLEGCIIKTFECISDVKRDLGFDISAISRCCKGKQNSSYGYKWKFANE